MARQGMVATSHPLASAAGLQALRAGGTAVDAAIAANAVLGLAEPTGAGIGGDLFAIVWDPASRRLHGLNASGRSPRALELGHFRRNKLTAVPAYGPLSVSVPGAVDGWFELHARFGRTPMPELLAPAVAHAREGFPVTEIIAGYWAHDVERFGADAEFARVFTLDGRAPIAGEIFRNPRLAETYAMIGSNGREAFYRGIVAERIEAQMASSGGFLAREDLASHVSDWTAPIATNYRGFDVWELPPNGQGIAVLQMLNLLEAYELVQLGWGSAEHLHLLVEVKKLAFEDRARHYADPSFASVPVEALISKDYAAERRALIDAARAAQAPGAGDPLAFAGGDTVYLATADAAGMMVSLIQSNYRGMGSGVMVPDSGFMLHNRGEMFALDPEHPNCYAPGKRPFHTIIPGFVTREGRPLMAFGVMGAAMQPQGHVQVLSNIIDFGMNLQTAGDAPRVRHEGSSEPTGTTMRDGGHVLLESQFAEASAAGLRSRGHRVSRARDGFGGYQAVLFDEREGAYHGASESRKDGCAMGY
jgi:gamma-glutamyltranspeptidase/glutathione hydrolase